MRMPLEVQSFIERLENLISNMYILSRTNYKSIFVNDDTIKGVKDFRKYLFRDDISEIKKLLQRYDNIEEIDSILSTLESLKKDGKFVSKSTFAREFQRKINEIKESDEYSIYRKILENVLHSFKNKRSAVERTSKKEVPDTTTFYLFLAIFILFTLKETLLHHLDERTVRDKIISNFRIDFLYGFSYTESRAHTVLRLTQNDINIINQLRKLFHDRDTVYSRYNQLRKELEGKGFQFDMLRPIIRENYRAIFGESWDSLIIIIYPEASRSYIRVLRDDRGIKTEFRRLASVLYIEFVISRDNESVLLIINRPISRIDKRESKESNIIRKVLSSILGLDFDIICSEADIYGISAEKLFSSIRNALEAKSEIKLAKALKDVIKKFKKELENTIDKYNFQYNEKLKQFITHLVLSKIYIRIMIEHRKVMNLEVELSPPDKLHPYNDISIIAEDIKNLVNAARHFHNIGSITPILGIWLRSKIDDETVEIGFESEGDVYFHNLRRDYATELSFVLSQVLKD